MSRLSGMSTEVTWDIPNTAANQTATLEVIVPGAKPGDYAFFSHDGLVANDTADGLLTGAVVANDTVRAQFHADADGQNPATGTLRVKVVPYDAL